VHAHWSREPRCSTWRRQRAASETGIHSRQRAGVPGGARALVEGTALQHPMAQ